MAWTKICIVFTTISNQWVCRTRLYFYPALFLVFHQREMLDKAVSERTPPHTHTLRLKEQNAVMLNSMEMWVPVGLEDLSVAVGLKK